METMTDHGFLSSELLPVAMTGQGWSMTDHAFLYLPSFESKTMTGHELMTDHEKLSRELLP